MIRDDTAQQQWTTSLWQQDAGVRELSNLSSDISADVCIVGGGIAGLTTAYLLADQDLSIVVLDAAPIGSGETGRTSAHLSFALDDRFYNLEQLHGLKGSRLAAESHQQAIDTIETICAHEHIACDFERVDGYLYLAAGDRAESLIRELEAARRAGISAVEYLEGGGSLPGPCLRFPNQAIFHPLRYLIGIAEAAANKGVRIYTNAHVQETANGMVTTNYGYHVASHVQVFATNTPINDRFTIHTKQAPYRTYVIGMPIAKGSVPRALFWDTGDPYHYVRTQPHSQNEDILLVGGEDHKTGQSDEVNEAHFVRLADWTKLHFPKAGPVQYSWSGQVLESVDSLAFIGRNPGDEPTVFVVTGDSGHGLTHGTIAGLLIRDLILERPNEWEQLYAPARITLRSAGEFLRENLNVAAQYTDFVRPGDADSPQGVAPGSGAVLQQGLSKIAAFRDEDGALFLCSAVCPHLGCVVSWNTAEKTWDCPCHGSRFTPLGEVINGPAVSGLEPVDSK